MLEHVRLAQRTNGGRIYDLTPLSRPIGSKCKLVVLPRFADRNPHPLKPSKQQRHTAYLVPNLGFVLYAQLIPPLEVHQPRCISTRKTPQLLSGRDQLHLGVSFFRGPSNGGVHCGFPLKPTKEATPPKETHHPCFVDCRVAMSMSMPSTYRNGAVCGSNPKSSI